MTVLKLSCAVSASVCCY